MHRSSLNIILHQDSTIALRLVRNSPHLICMSGMQNWGIQQQHSREDERVEDRHRQLDVPKVPRAVLVAQPAGGAAATRLASAVTGCRQQLASTAWKLYEMTAELYCAWLAAPHLSCVSMGPMAGSYRPFGTTFFRLSNTRGLVTRLTLSLRIC